MKSPPYFSPLPEFGWSGPVSVLRGLIGRRHHGRVPGNNYSKGREGKKRCEHSGERACECIVCAYVMMMNIYLFGGRKR